MTPLSGGDKSLRACNFELLTKKEPTGRPRSNHAARQRGTSLSAFSRSIFRRAQHPQAEKDRREMPVSCIGASPLRGIAASFFQATRLA